MATLTAQSRFFMFLTRKWKCRSSEGCVSGCPPLWGQSRCGRQNLGSCIPAPDAFPWTGLNLQNQANSTKANEMVFDGRTETECAEPLGSAGVQVWMDKGHCGPSLVAASPRPHTRLGREAGGTSDTEPLLRRSAAAQVPWHRNKGPRLACWLRECEPFSDKSPFSRPFILGVEGGCWVKALWPPRSLISKENKKGFSMLNLEGLTSLPHGI